MKLIRCWVSDGLLILAAYLMPKDWPEGRVLVICLELYAKKVSEIRGFDATC